jgi:copper chaperone CopZ
MKFYDLMRFSVTCPYCGNKIEQNLNKMPKRKIPEIGVEENLKEHINFDFGDEGINGDDDNDDDEVVVEVAVLEEGNSGGDDDNDEEIVVVPDDLDMF